MYGPLSVFDVSLHSDFPSVQNSVGNLFIVMRLSILFLQLQLIHRVSLVTRFLMMKKRTKSRTERGEYVGGVVAPEYVDFWPDTVSQIKQYEPSFVSERGFLRT